MEIIFDTKQNVNYQYSKQIFDIKLYENGNSCHSQTVSELPPRLPMGGDDVAAFHI